MKRSKTSTAQLSFDLTDESMCSAEAFPVRIFRRPAEELASLVLEAAFGSSSPGSCESSDLPTSSSRTCPLFPQEVSTASSNRLPRAGTMRSGYLSELPTWVRRTVGNGSSWSRGEYPTPTASSYGSSQNGINGKGGDFERPSASTISLWAYARRELWPTATASDAKMARRAGYMLTGNQGRTLLDAAATHFRLRPTTRQDGERGPSKVGLNPEFVEVLMGFPRAWSESGSE